MKVKDVMSKSIIAVNISSSISSASKSMKEYDIGFLPIESENDIIGVITDRDIVIRAISKGIDTNDSIEKYISTNIISIDQEEDIEEALALMAEEKVKRLLVEENKKTVGILSLSDILSVKKDSDVIECIANIFGPIGTPLTTNEVNLIEAEVDEFEL